MLRRFFGNKSLRGYIEPWKKVIYGTTIILPVSFIHNLIWIYRNIPKEKVDKSIVSPFESFWKPGLIPIKNLSEIL